MLLVCLHNAPPLLPHILGETQEGRRPFRGCWSWPFNDVRMLLNSSSVYSEHNCWNHSEIVIGDFFEVSNGYIFDKIRLLLNCVLTWHLSSIDSKNRTRSILKSATYVSTGTYKEAAPYRFRIQTN